MDEKTAKAAIAIIRLLSHILEYIAMIGVPIAVQISWGLNHSIAWAAWHGFCGWFYVIYRYSVGIY